METQPRQTLLHQWHISRGAKMSVFGGYDMPLWYASALNEHLTVIGRAGLFDTGHMASVMVTGADAFDLLQHCFTNDLTGCVGKEKKALFPGRCVYGAFLDEKGGVIDDAIVFMMGKGEYLVVVNAGMGQTIAAQLSANRGKRNVSITDLTDQVGKMDIQGPFSAKILQKVLSDPQKVFDNMPYFSFKGHFDETSPLSSQIRLKDHTPILLSRTGYTGEFGFEIFLTPAHFLRVWEMLMKTGEEFGLTACGLAARDSLRAGAVLPLSHQDIGHWPFIRHPWSFALPYAKDGKGFTKDFTGSQALLNAEHAEYTCPFAGDDPRKVTLPAIAADAEGHEIGTVLTCATDMAIGRHNGKIFSIASPNKPDGFSPKGLSCGFVKVKKKLSPGDIVELHDGRRKIKVHIVQDIRPDRTARKSMKNMLQYG
ncbi:MAG: aminomethyltransferase family protein [Desulfococcaceae bacterium]